MSSVREELQVARVQHKQQLAEMAALREEEKQKAFLDKEASQDRLRSDMERLRQDLERSHQQEKEAAQEKVCVGNDGIVRFPWDAVCLNYNSFLLYTRST